jgi:VRR-NUC domain
VYVLPANFKRRRAPSTKRRAHPEDDLQVSVAAHLDWMLKPPATYTSIGHGGFSLGNTREEAIRRGARMKKRGVKPGWPDVLIIWNFRPFFLELKSKVGVLSADQKRVHAEIFAAGGSVAVCRSVDEAILHLKKMGIPLRFEKPSAALLRQGAERADRQL